MDKPTATESKSEIKPQSTPSIEPPPKNEAFKEEKQPKKGKKGLVIIFLLLGFCCLISIIAVVVLYFSAGTLIKGMATIQKDSTLTMITASEISDFDITETIKALTPTVDENNLLPITLSEDELLTYLEDQLNVALVDSLGMKIEENKAVFQIGISELYQITGKAPMLISADKVSGIIVNGELTLTSDKKSFVVSSLTTGNSLADTILLKDVATALSSVINTNLATLLSGLNNIQLSSEEAVFSYTITPVDLDSAVSLVEDGIPLVFDREQLQYRQVDETSFELYFTPKQWLENMMVVLADTDPTVSPEDFYMEISGDQLIYYISMNILQAQSVTVDFADPSRHFVKIVLEANNTDGIYVTSASFENSIIDTYFSDGLLEECEGLNSPLTGVIKGAEIGDGKITLTIEGQAE